MVVNNLPKGCYPTVLLLGIKLYYCWVVGPTPWPLDYRATPCCRICIVFFFLLFIARNYVCVGSFLVLDVVSSCLKHVHLSCALSNTLVKFGCDWFSVLPVIFITWFTWVLWLHLLNGCFCFVTFVFQFNVTNDSFENALNAAKFAVQRNRNKLGTVPDRTE